MSGILQVLSTMTLWVVRSRKPQKPNQDSSIDFGRKDLERLISDISRAVRYLAGPSRSGGLFMIREKQEELGRLLADLQRRMRMLDERGRRKYEPRAEGILADAAKLGVTLPPP
jgi:hypothetical protein